MSTAPRAARKPRETPEQKKACILARTRELILIAKRGDTPEEIIEKGKALQELKRLRPWKHQGIKGGFGKWAKLHLPYHAARANHYILIATRLRLEQVAGKNLSFESLLEIARAPADRHQELIVAAEGGIRGRALRRMAQGEEAPGPDDPVARAEQVVRLKKKLCAELRLLCNQVNDGAQLPPALLRQMGEGGAVLQQLLAELASKMDLIGSISGSETPAPQGDRAAPVLLCATGPAEQSATLGLVPGTSTPVRLELDKNFSGFLFGEGHTEAADHIVHTCVAQVHRPLCAIEIVCAPQERSPIGAIGGEIGAPGHQDIVLVCHEEHVQPLRQRHPHVQVFPFPQGRYQMPDLIRPGRQIIVDPRGAGLGRQEELDLGQAALKTLTRRDQGTEVGLLVRVDEAHEALSHQGFASLLGLLIREREERDLRLLLQTGDPRAVPQALLGGADLIGVGRMKGKRPLAWLTRARPAFAAVDEARLAKYQERVMLLLAADLWFAQREEAIEDCLVEVLMQAAKKS